MYVDGFVVPVKAKRKEAYIEMCREVALIALANGATRVVECWPDDVPDGEVTSFRMAAKLEEDEAVCFSWIEYPDRAARDRAMAAVASDPIMDDDKYDNPVAGNRMIFGGFKAVMDQR